MNAGKNLNGWDLGRLVRPNIGRLKGYESARQKSQQGILLDANELPHPSPVVAQELNRYPDPTQRELKRRLAGYLNVSQSNVVAGAGSDEVIDWIFKVFCQPGVDRVAIVEPTYGMYRVCADIWGVEVQQFQLGPRCELDSDDLLRRAAANVKAIFLCSPNNPTGNLLKRAEILSLTRRFGGIVIVDEAYIEFASEPSIVSKLAECPGLIVLRTLSKAWGLAGLRLGYAVAAADIIACFEKVKAPYNLSLPVQRQACEALSRSGQLPRICGSIRTLREELRPRLLAQSGVLEVLPSEANFLLFRCHDSARLCRGLLEKGILVRDRSSLAGLANWVRVTVGTAAENELFLQGLKEILP